MQTNSKNKVSNRLTKYVELDFKWYQKYFDIYKIDIGILKNITNLSS